MEGQWDYEITNYYVALPYNIIIQVFVLLLNIARLHCHKKCPLAQEIWLGSPNHFSSWEGGVWGLGTAARATLSVDSAMLINTFPLAMWILNLVTLCYIMIFPEFHIILILCLTLAYMYILVQTNYTDILFRRLVLMWLTPPLELEQPVDYLNVTFNSAY